jgi:hypothetical protein
MEKMTSAVDKAASDLGNSIGGGVCYIEITSILIEESFGDRLESSGPQCLSSK